MEGDVAAKRKSPPGIKVDVPDAFRAALSRHPKARAVFEAFPPSHQRAYVEYVVEAKRPETRARRIEKSLAAMVARAKR
jgi:uncharacterized protein YdeI (YjbR/CyaY-like superfamily)